MAGLLPSVALPGTTHESAFRLPEGDLAAGAAAHDAAPADRALAGLEEDGGAQAARAVGRRADLAHLDIRQPQRPRRRAFDDPAAQFAAHLQGEVGLLRGVDALGAPAAELRVELARLREVSGVQLEVHDGLARGAHGG